jgi:stage III sporulation protein AD
MMDIVLICSFAVISTVMCLSIRRDAQEIRLLLTAAAAVVIFLKAAGSLSGIIAEMRSMFTEGDIDPEYLRILLKGLGICHVTSFAAGICRDSGEPTLAEQTMTAGKTALLLTALPLLEALLTIVRTLLQ